ncbi:DNA glycosylase [Thermothelomyces heterothallicus CBS 203.75]
MASDAKIANSAPQPLRQSSSATRKRKAALQAPAAEKPADPPSTPRKRRAKGSDDAPETPTPVAVSLIAEEAHTQKPKPAAIARLADPNRTNALLRSPKTSRIIVPTPVEAVPSKLRDRNKSTGPAAAAAASEAAVTTTTTRPTTTANLLEEACAHLIKVDPRMKPLIEKHYCRIFSPEGLAEQIDPFESLCSSIISQQVSGAAAKSIKARFIALFNNSNNGGGSNGGGSNDNSNNDNNNSHTAGAGADRVDGMDRVDGVDRVDRGDRVDGVDGVDGPAAAATFPSPAEVAAMPLERLRTAGLSQRKAEYIQGLAAKFATGELTAQMLADAPYEEVLERLTAVRGLGRWTVEMFACFALKRMDVFSTGDLGVQRGMAAFVGRDVGRLKAKGGGGGGGKWKYMSEREMEEISDRFRPYRSLFMWYMWRVEETDVSTMEK